MLRAIIFDFDGVIVDSERHHLRAFQQTLRDEGVDLAEADYYAAYLGLDDKACFRAVLENHGRRVSNEEVRSFVERKAGYYDRIKDEVSILPGVTPFIHTAAQRYPLAIGSGSLRHEIEYALDRASIRTAIRVVVGAEDVERGKPYPDCYRTVLKRLNDGRSNATPPFLAAECVVIEDAPRGVAAAKAAGMRCVAVTSSYAAGELSAADLIVSGLAVLTVEQMETLG